MKIAADQLKLKILSTPVDDEKTRKVILLELSQNGFLDGRIRINEVFQIHHRTQIQRAIEGKQFDTGATALARLILAEDPILLPTRLALNETEMVTARPLFKSMARDLGSDE